MVKVDETGMVTFSLSAERGHCDEVYVAGKFNGWDPRVTRMPYIETKNAYEVSVKLSEGLHPYKFVVNEVWTIDSDNARTVPNDHGGYNSIVEVGACV